MSVTDRAWSTGAGSWIELEVFVEQASLPNWESEMIDDAIRTAEDRREKEKTRAKKRALQLAREQGYHRLAAEIDRPSKTSVNPGQLSFFPTDPTLFDETQDL